MSSAPGLTLVAAVARNGVMGRDGGLPWHLPGDLQHFRRTTWGHPMLMGRRTFQSIGRALPGRETVVLTRDEGFTAAGVHVAHDLAGALAQAAVLAGKMGVDQIMLVGGGELYHALIERASRLIITEVDADVSGDVMFPLISAGQWQLLARSELAREKGDDFSWRHASYARIAAPAALAYKASL
ncbi:MAG: dihydrofolate reductase [Hyphomicrobiales bacterium]|nr:dihydrofolate reductase [Hyphomicrobiales bacterium]